ncbi:MAG: hypothetical protein K0S74_1587 [Chlamydiales bacterium]|jgi:hypothetical protein|nr:hypothetical protein [Chlamydiales bacterium]
MWMEKVLGNTVLVLKTCLIFGMSCFHAYAELTEQNKNLLKEENNINTLDKPYYIDYRMIHPGQLRYASRNVEDKIQIAQEKGDLEWDSTHKKWIYKQGQGLSIYPLNKALPIIKSVFGFVLVDGHHDLLASITVGAKTIPVKIIMDLSDLSEEDFWNKAEEMGLVYLYDLKGNKSAPPAYFKQLQDDPNRYFAAIIARKYEKEADVTGSQGADYPLWIKKGKDIPYIEFKIADALWRANLIYSYKMGDNPPVEFVEKARQVLIQAQIPGLRLVKERKHYTQVAP